MKDFIKQLKVGDNENVKVFNNIKDAIKHTTSEMKQIHKVIHKSIEKDIKHKGR